MSLAHVLLTSLIEKPSTGSELARRFDRSMGFFWNATHQQIYRELSGMQKKHGFLQLKIAMTLVVRKHIRWNNSDENNLLNGW